MLFTKQWGVTFYFLLWALIFTHLHTISVCNCIQCFPKSTISGSMIELKRKKWFSGHALDYWIRISWAEAQESVFFQRFPNDFDKQPALRINNSCSGKNPICTWAQLLATWTALDKSTPRSSGKQGKWWLHNRVFGTLTGLSYVIHLSVTLIGGVSWYSADDLEAYQRVFILPKKGVQLPLPYLISYETWLLPSSVTKDKAICRWIMRPLCHSF